MKRMLIAGVSVLAVIAMIGACANPLQEDGEYQVVQDFEGEPGIQSVSLSWTDPDVDFAEVQIKYWTGDEDVETVYVDKGTEEFQAEDLTGGEEYTFEARLISAGGQEADEKAVIDVTPLAEESPHDAYIAGNFTGWGHEPMEQVSWNEWQYEFTAEADEEIEFKITDGEWDSEEYSYDQEPLEVGELVDLQTAADEPGNTVASVEEGNQYTVTFWFIGEDEEGDPQLRIDEEVPEPAEFSPQVWDIVGEDGRFMRQVTQNEWTLTVDAGDAGLDETNNLVIADDGTPQYGVPEDAEFEDGVLDTEMVAWDDDEHDTDNAFDVPAEAEEEVEFTFWFDRDGEPAIRVEVHPEEFEAWWTPHASGSMNGWDTSEDAEMTVVPDEDGNENEWEYTFTAGDDDETIEFKIHDGEWDDEAGYDEAEATHNVGDIVGLTGDDNNIIVENLTEGEDYTITFWFLGSDWESGDDELFDHPDVRVEQD